MVAGDLKEGAADLSRACDLLAGVPDYQLLPFALAQSALAMIQLGRSEDGLALLGRSRAMRRKHSVRGHLATRALTATAECYLWLLEASSIPSSIRRADLLRLAQRACAEAVRHGRTVHDHGKPDALRLSGMLEWQLGRRQAAKTFWLRSCELAEPTGHDTCFGQSRYEIGRRFDSREDLELAEQLFLQSGALAELRKDETLLSRSAPIAPPATVTTRGSMGCV